MKINRILEKVLKKTKLLETIRSYEINPQHRAWFIDPNGTILGGLSHNFILKDNFAKDLETYKNNGEEEGAILLTFEKRLLKTGSIKIGEFNNSFYADVSKLYNSEVDMIMGFTDSLIKIRGNDISACEMTIYDYNNERDSCSLKNILNGCLFKSRLYKNE